MAIYKDAVMEITVSHGLLRAKELITDFLVKHPEYKGIVWEGHWLQVQTETGLMSIEDISWEKKADLIALEEAIFAAEHEACDCKTLDELINKHPCCKHFRPGAFYNIDGDMLEVDWDNESVYGKELKGRHGYSSMCLMKSQEDDHVAGVKVYGLKKILKDAGFKIVPI